MDLGPLGHNLPDLRLSNLDIEKLSTEDRDELISILEDLTTPSLADYIPQEKQKIFHCATQKYRIITGGNRSGKTTSGAAEDAYHATGQYPDWYPKEGRFKGATQGRVIVTNFKEGAAIFEKRLLEVLPKNLIVQIKRVPHTGTIEKVLVKHVSGETSTIEILTHEQADTAFEGWNGHWAHFDEPPPRTKFIATIRGLIDLKGRCWMTLTPLNEPWLYDQFFENVDPNVFTLRIDIRDNKTLSEEEIADFEKRVSEDEKEARLHGKFRHLVGLVYKEFDMDVHLVSQSSTKLDSKWPVYFSFDPADRRPHVGVWARINPFGTILVFQEICFKGTIEEVSQQILTREKLWGINSETVIRYLDPNKGRTPERTGGQLTIQDMFAQYGVYFDTNVNDDVATGHLAVQQRLHWDKKKPITLTNAPKIFFIRENTQKCVSQLRKYVWADHKDSARDLQEKPRDSNKDYPDVIRYLCVCNPIYQDPKDRDILPSYNRITGWMD